MMPPPAGPREDSAQGVAVIGVGGRFPGAGDIRQFWHNLRDGVDSISFFELEEVIAAGVDPQLAADPNYVRAAGLLDAADQFDAEFFGFSPREAERMDPQHRIFLETAWSALENAGYDPGRCPGAVGVYGGASLNTYLLNNLFAGQPFLPAMNDLQTLVGNDKDFLTSRVSYKLNLTGPSVVVQTACSTSLVAIAKACQDLLTYQCDIALAGGVCVRVPQRRGYLHQPDSIFSPDGRCRPFDAKSAGTVFGNGVGIAVLKRLDEALEDGDSIRAVIRGFAVNNDGSNKVGYTAPSVDRQSEVVATALAVAGVDPETIGYVETHGTGTALGDPIEVAALTAAFGVDLRRAEPCWIGSVKSNIGHLDAAAGIASFLKTVLALEHRQLPPSLHFESPNPAIDFESGPFAVNDRLRDWPSTGVPRRAGVSSLGIGGTNVHIVLEEAPARDQPSVSPENQLLVLSARSAAALEEAAKGLAERLRAAPGLPLADVAHTLQVGRAAMPYRRAVVCRSIDEAVANLEAPPSNGVQSSRTGSEPGPLAFMFPGQGTQHPGMARDLYESEERFKQELDRCVELFEPHLGCDLRELLFPNAEDEDEAGRRIERTILAQPAIFAVSYALARLWMSWGVFPAAMIGHSLGELVAACLAGVFELPQAVALVAARGRLIQELPGGSMLTVGQAASEVENDLPEDLALAAVNGPQLTVVSGPTPAIESYRDELTARGVTSRGLHTSHAFHSPMMEPILEALTEEVRRAKPQPPKLPFISGLTGDWITDREATAPSYWSAQVTGTIRFASGLRSLSASSPSTLLECGPGNTLTTLAKSAGYPEAIASLPRPGSRVTDGAQVMDALGRLWLAGVQPIWEEVHAGEQRLRVELPTYPFERRSFWVEPAAREEADGARLPMRDWFSVPSWSRGPQLAPLDAALSDASRNWLVVGDTSGLGGDLVAALEARGQQVEFRTGRGSSSSRDGARPTGPKYQELLNELASDQRSPEIVLFLDDSLEALAFFCQALGAQANGSCRLVLITRDAFEVDGNEQIAPSNACLPGFLKALPHEHPEIDCRVIDLSSSLLSASDAALAERVLVEALRPNSATVALRSRFRWLATLIREPLESPAQVVLNGPCLITGGLGGMGLALAHYLLTAAARLGSERGVQLVLTSRTELPDRSEWPSWLEANPEDSTVRRRVQAVLDLEAAGAEVLLGAADVADADSMARLLTEAETRFGQVRGVIHAAGVPGPSLIRNLTPEALAQVLRSKLQGTQVLDELFRERQLDFLVLCSSLATVHGGAGLGAYCAANAYLDAYAAGQAGRRDRRVVAIAWDAWRDVGMAHQAFAAHEPERISHGLTASEGTEVFRLALGSRVPNLVVSTRRLDRSAPRTIPAANPVDTDPVDGPPVSESPQRSAPEIGTDVERRVAQLWTQLLGVKTIAPDQDFFELGGHSLLATQLINRLRVDYPNAELTMRGFFDGPTIAELAASISGSKGSLELSQKLNRTRLLAAPDELRTHLLEEYLEAELATLGSDQTRRLVVAHLRQIFERDFDLRVYAQELRTLSGTHELAEFVLTEVSRSEAPPEVHPKTTGRLPQAIFVLSSPRSGSTLLRVMLSGHPALFSPPELSLLAFETLASWNEAPDAELHREGYLRALTTLLDNDAAAAARRLETMIESNQSTSDSYRVLQQLAAPRVLVDKAPVYATQMATLERAEALFEQPLYIHLCRHPYAVIDSFVRARFDRLRGDLGDPYSIAEDYWKRSHRNLLELEQRVGAERCHLIRFEQLLTDPEETLRRLLKFLKLPYDDATLRPYEAGEMLGGPGDPELFARGKIDPTRAELWRDIRLPRPLGEESRKLAEALGYELP